MSHQVYISRSPQRGSFMLRDLSLDEQMDRMTDRLDLELAGLLAEQDHSLEYDLRTTQWILDLVRTRDDYAQNLYAALCNNEFRKNDVVPILQDRRWSCSWRRAGGIIADMQEQGDYIDWYLSGMNGNTDTVVLNPETNYVVEGTITNEIEADLLKLGWLVIPV